MAARYRLPDALGGGEVSGEVITTGISMGVGEDPVLLICIDGVGLVAVPMAALIEVAPPLPPEPQSRAYVVDREGDCWQGFGGEWNSPFSAFSPSWADLNAKYGPLRLMVPDPMAEAPELPWRDFTGGRLGELYVNRTTPDTTGAWVMVGNTEVRMDCELARQMGLALLRAAAEQETSAPLPDWERELIERQAARPRSCPTCHSAGMPRDIPLLGSLLPRTCPDRWHQEVIG